MDRTGWREWNSRFEGGHHDHRSDRPVVPGRGGEVWKDPLDECAVNDLRSSEMREERTKTAEDDEHTFLSIRAANCRERSA